MNIIPGKQIANSILTKLSQHISSNINKPTLGIILVGNDASSRIYVANKINDAHKVGIQTVLQEYESIDEKGILDIVNEWNSRSDINGFIIQLPLPLDAKLVKILERINPSKDVDGLSPVSLGAAWQKNYDLGFLPATVLAVKECLKHVSIYSDNLYEVDELSAEFTDKQIDSFVRGKNVVIVNDSLIVGRPLAAMMLNYGATVTIAHRDTLNLAQITKQADILMTGTGVIGLISGDMIKDGAVLIDIGIKKDINGQIKGDIDFESVKHLNGWITPVPNGVGPLTRAMLLVNTFEAFSNLRK